MGELVFKDLGTSDSDQIWFIAWIGSLKTPILRGSAKISVLLYPLKSSVSKSDFTGHPNQLEFRKFKISEIDVGYLTLIRTGQLIRKDKIIVQSDSYFSKIKFKVSFEKNHDFKVMPIENFFLNISQTEKDDQIIKYKVYDFPLIIFHKSLVLCLRKGIEQFSNYDYIIIPCTEQIGFYFCTSDNLAQELFTGGLHHSPNTLFNEKYHVSEYRINSGAIHYVHLRFRIPDEDHKIVGRIAYSSEAMRAAKAIYNSMRKGSINKSYLNPITYFPFSGDSDLTVCGRKIQANGLDKQYSEKSIFLVYNIRSCSGKFPFERIDYFRENSGEAGETDNDNPPPSGWGGKNDSNYKNNQDKHAKSGGSHNKGLQKLDKTEFDQRFLHKVVSEKLKKGQQVTQNSSGFLPPAGPTDNFTTDPESEGESNEGQLDIQIDTNRYEGKEKEKEKKQKVVRSKDKYEEHFVQLIKMFEDSLECTVNYFSEDKSNYVYFEPEEYWKNDPINFNKRNLSYKWATGGFMKVMERRKEWLGQRVAMAVLVTEKKSNKKFILLDAFKTETEKSKPGLQILCLYNHDHVTHLTLTKVKQILKICAVKRRVWLDNEVKELERGYFNHYIDHGVETTYNSIRIFLKKFGFTLSEIKKEKKNYTIDSSPGIE
jgi:hypothetical protein